MIRALSARSALAALVLALGLAACTKPTPYQALDGRYGYDTQTLEQDRYRVSFFGNTATPRKTVENYLLYRAAELTLEKGGRHFVVVYREMERHGNFANDHPGWNTSFGVGSCWGCGWSSGVSTGVVFGVPASSYPQERYDAFMEIAVRPGPPPDGDPHAYDARQVIDRLGPTLVRSEAG